MSGFSVLGFFDVICGMTSNEAYKLYQTMANKAVSGFINMDEFARLFNQGQVELQKQLYSNIAKYGPQMPKSSPSDDDNKRVQAALAPFIKAISIQLSSGFGNYNPDADFNLGPTQVTATGYCKDCCEGDPIIRYRATVQWLGDGEFDRRCNDPIDYPRTTDPIARFYDKGRIEVSPVNINYVEFRYYRKPNKIYVGRTIVNGREFPNEVDPLNVNPEWNDPEIMAIIVKVLEYTGVVLNDSLLLQYGLQKEQIVK
jgi:hypothetical protein